MTDLAEQGRTGLPEFVYTKSEEKPRKAPNKDAPGKNGSEEWESVDESGGKALAKTPQPKEIFLTQQAEQKQENAGRFLTMNEKKTDSREHALATLANESDSKISINFNINNNYLLKNQLQDEAGKSSQLKSIQSFASDERSKPTRATSQGPSNM